MVPLAVVCLLAPLLFPGMKASRRSAWRSTCTNNLRQLVAAIRMYQDHHGERPLGFYVWRDETGAPQRATWEMLVMPDVGHDGIFVCPADPDQRTLAERLAQNPVNPSYMYILPLERDIEGDAEDLRRMRQSMREATQQGTVLTCQHHRPHALAGYADGSVRLRDEWP